ncbi:MAG TPA: hypothetical protein DCG19_10115 [Cryomorphaceae bacterium]|nr:hypothetical protein [Owenweeksia sp.]MBF99787.1 hypothetical protein [Owenweeksia sp.]HAD97750.1 hypothetical protein [Cryomorphaceae bacterium]HBF19229.1 hypothetical protein [Cryomorphaceae bacterium]HCQ15524.1 hypothetical protein [Cryomorphaceae bacterium]|tara:strand:+ start:3706 stop:4296 length:591 start_codon:yes stop_codon:yes gene_type:complete
MIIIAYMAWNNFETPTIFWSETGYTQAVVTKHKLVPGFARGYAEKVTYAYRVGDSLYSFRMQLNRRKGWRSIGSKMKIKYQLSNPQKHVIDAYYVSDFHQRKDLYRWSGLYQYNELIIENGVVKFDRYGERGKLLSHYVGQAWEQDDTLLITDLLMPLVSQNVRMTFIKERHLQNGMFYVDLRTGKQYKKKKTHSR